MTQPSPSPGVRGAPSAQPTQPAPSGSASAGMPNTGDKPGALPTTGPDAGVLAIAGVLAVLGGAVLARRARVRRGG